MVANDVDRRTCVAEPIKVGEIGNGGQGNRIYSVDGKSVSQTATSGGIGSNTGLYAIPIEFDEGKPIMATSCADGKEHPVYEVKDGQIIINGKQHPINLVDGYYIFRKLTITECKRLQTVPEWYDFSVISNSQAYKCLGNGWTCEVITHLIKATQTAARRKWLDELLGDCL
jgi:DNA (cytosine-5)-methyltransferase 3A